MYIPKCHLIGAGEFFPANLYPKQEGDIVIAVDGGLKWLRNEGIKPDFYIGDFDSHQMTENEFADNVIRLDREKNDTDMFSALMFAYNKGFREFHIHGGTGGRPDHTVANIQSLVNLSRKGAGGLLFFENYYITSITNSSIIITGIPGDYISIHAYSGFAEGVTLTGLKYNLTEACISDDYPIGTSNEFTSETAQIAVKNGTLLITVSIS
jgi:thiamine pyrophosphokinase